MSRIIQNKIREKIEKRANGFTTISFSQYVAEYPSDENFTISSKDPLDLLTPFLDIESNQEQHVVDCIEVQRLLASLSIIDREIIELRYFEDCSEPEIAQKLHCTTSSIGLRIHRVLKKLRSTYPL